MPIKAILFDLDGTLLDTETLSDRAMFAAIGRTSNCNDLLPWQLKKRILGRTGADWGPIVLDYAKNIWNMCDSELPSSVDGLVRLWETKLGEYCTEVKICPGAIELVAKFASMGLPMAIATSSQKSGVALKRKRHEESLFSPMSAIVCGDDPAVGHGKPAPDIYLEAARRLGVPPEDCLVFEDSLMGVQAGRAAGCQVVAIPDSRFNSKELATFQAEADVVLDSLSAFDESRFGL